MDSRFRLFIAGLVGALTAFIFTVIAFTGVLNLIETTVFAGIFLVVMIGFERFMLWAETLENAESSTEIAR
ncbi:hypothetical protein [Halalkalicoccus jeotgali]|uniref:Uncharacterized protein n=1 Tax=Halalkalicoccus jeotgali (strain DSM 18796 / CECT 7217 / JCM 14584 / KCTC 4019 / B3) TaxID=795797 RepID=D8J6N7_HALJB|nr:hypothetical protein [Halalkalicoccus jeotgali]ADJ13914.1 hypothetical protein HacjB3_02605 [Halalkalicoccus jeotgali B3]ELY34041.1 hypothetical protein C497_16717 [Halalkalicoccus jeotgali B3]